MARRQPNWDEFEDFGPWGGTVFHGHSDVHESDYFLLDEQEAEELRREWKKRLAKKRPPGFAPWPETKTGGKKR